MKTRAAWLFGFLVAVWTMGLLSWVVFKTFEDVTQINAAVVSALSAVLGVPAVAAGIAALARRHWGDGQGGEQ